MLDGAAAAGNDADSEDDDADWAGSNAKVIAKLEENEVPIERVHRWPRAAERGIAAQCIVRPYLEASGMENGGPMPHSCCVRALLPALVSKAISCRHIMYHPPASGLKRSMQV